MKNLIASLVVLGASHAHAMPPVLASLSNQMVELSDLNNNLVCRVETVGNDKVTTIDLYTRGTINGPIGILQNGYLEKVVTNSPDDLCAVVKKIKGNNPEFNVAYGTFSSNLYQTPTGLGEDLTVTLTDRGPFSEDHTVSLELNKAVEIVADVPENLSLNGSGDFATVVATQQSQNFTLFPGSKVLSCVKAASNEGPLLDLEVVKVQVHNAHDAVGVLQNSVVQSTFHNPIEDQCEKVQHILDQSGMMFGAIQGRYETTVLYSQGQLTENINLRIFSTGEFLGDNPPQNIETLELDDQISIVLK